MIFTRNVGWCYGFPRVTTIDGASYTVDALGEYWLIDTVGTPGNTYFSLQARTAPSISARTNKTSGGTSFVGFAMQGGESPTVEVHNHLTYSASFIMNRLSTYWIAIAYE